MLSLSVLLLQDVAPAALEASVDMTLVYMLSGLALVTIIVLGLKFLRNMFEVLTAPAASLRHHGHEDHFFFSLMLVFLGGLIGTIILIMTQQPMIDAFSAYSSTVAADMARGNPNQIYHDVVQAEAESTMNNNFAVYFLQTLIVMPMLFIAVWMIFGTLNWLITKIFGGQADWVDIQGTLAYPGFFAAIGFCLMLPAIFGFIAGMVGASAPAPGVGAIIGGVLMLYALVLYFMGVAQAAEISAGHMIGLVIILAIVFGGLFYWANSSATESFASFKSRIQSFNPASQQI